MEYEKFLYIYYILVCVFSFLGLFGNLYCLMALCKKVINKPWTRILIGLLLFDIVILITYLLGALLAYLNSIGVVESQDWEELEFMPLIPINKTAYVGAIYTTILITLQQYLTICWPQKKDWHLQRKGIIFFLGFVFQFAAIVNIPRWLESGLGYNSETYILYYHFWFWVTIYFIIPTCMLGVLNFCIWRQACKIASVHPINVRRQPDISLVKLLFLLFFVFLVVNALYTLILTFFFRKELSIDIFMEFFASGPIIIHSSIFLILWTTVKEIRIELVKIGRHWRICCKSKAMYEPANANKTILDTNKIEIFSYTFDKNFDDRKVKCIITKA